MESPLFHDPIRVDGLNGAEIVNLSRIKTCTPLIFPKPITVEECMDKSLHIFYTLQELTKNPLLTDSLTYRRKANPSQNQEIVESKVFSRERNVFKSAELLIPKITNNLVSDEQLAKFLSQGRERFPSAGKQKKIIENLISDEYANQPVANFLGKAVRENFLESHASTSSVRDIDLPMHKSETSSISSPVVQFESLVPPPSTPEPLVVLDEQFSEELIAHNPKATNLKLLARKPSRDGSLRPAQASEIYLTTQDLKELLKDFTKDPAIAGEVRSVAELWAKAEKNVSDNPEIALGVKSILLSAKVGRARTDPYGKASLENLSPDDKYFVIGIDKDVDTNVVTIWSKEVEVAPGENLVELTSTDVIYQE